MLAVHAVESVVSLGHRELTIVRPRDAEELLDEDAFDRDEFLPYWAELWPSGLALAGAIGGRPVAGSRVLELGCGLALPSIAAALAGARVLATDWSPEAVALASWNARRNGVQISTAVADWGDPSRLRLGAPWDVVLAADVLYERRNVDVLLGLVPGLVDGTGEVLLADPGRPAAASFLERAGELFTVESVQAAQVAVHRLRKMRDAPVTGVEERG
jgi:predicted nicotinamide N-methyase